MLHDARLSLANPRVTVAAKKSACNSGGDFPNFVVPFWGNEDSSMWGLDGGPPLEGNYLVEAATLSLATSVLSFTILASLFQTPATSC